MLQRLVEFMNKWNPRRNLTLSITLSLMYRSDKEMKIELSVDFCKSSWNHNHLLSISLARPHSELEWAISTTLFPFLN